MSRRKRKAHTEEVWAAWMKAQRKLMEAWAGRLPADAPSWDFTAPGATPLHGWQPPGLPGFNPWNAFSPAATDFFTSAFRQGGNAWPTPPWFKGGPGFPGGADLFTPPWLKSAAGLPGVEEMFLQVPSAWLQSLLGLWPAVADALGTVSRKVPHVEDAGLDEWRQALEHALAESKRIFEAGEENARAFTTRILSLGLPPLETGATADPAWGAAREWLEQWLSIPAMGPYREEQETAAKTVRLLFDVQDKTRAHNELLAGMGADVIDALRTRLLTMLEEGKSLTSLRGGFNLWVECCEKVYRERVMNDRYSKCYGEMINASFRLRKHLMQWQQRWLETQGWPSRRETDAVLDRQRDLEEGHNALVQGQRSSNEQLGEIKARQNDINARLDGIQQEQQDIKAQLSISQQAEHGVKAQLSGLDERLSQVLDVLQASVAPSQAEVVQAEATRGFDPAVAEPASADAYPESVTTSEAAMPSSRPEPPPQPPSAHAPAEDYWSSGRHD